MTKLHILVVIALLCLNFPENEDEKEVSKITFDQEAFHISFNRYAEFFDSDVEDVYAAINDLLPEIDAQARQYNLDSRLVLAVVAPEMLRYSSIGDFFETGVLETLYVTGGKDNADFSIGIFQMKASFIENIENYYKKHQILKSPNSLTQYKESTEIGIRKARINRLKDQQWQIIYACAFCQIMDHRFLDKHFQSLEEKVAFYSTAYNLGLDKDEALINYWVHRKAFPYGDSYGEEQCSYSEIALEFFKHTQ